MKLIPGLLSLFCLVSLTVLGQENYQDGYLVLVNGDTLRGRIDQQDWVANPGKIDMATNGNGSMLR